MSLLINFFLIMLNFIIAIFTNPWLFILFFLIIGFVTVKENKGAGGFCIFLALLTLVRVLF